MRLCRHVFFIFFTSLFMTAMSVQVGRKSPWTCENKQLWYLQQRGGRRLVSASLHLPGSERINPGKLPPLDTRVLISGKIYELYSSGEAFFLRTAHSHYSHKEGKFDVETNSNIRLQRNTTEIVNQSIYLFIDPLVEIKHGTGKLQETFLQNVNFQSPQPAFRLTAHLNVVICDLCFACTH